MAAQQKPEPGTAVATVATVGEPEPSYIMKTPIGRILTAPTAMSILSKVLPRGATIDRFLYECYHAVTQNPEILECTEQSIILAVGRAIETGLVIGRGVYLVPVRTKVSKRDEADRYEKRLQMWLGYQGEIELVRAAGVARHVDGHCVYANEHFEIKLGTHPSVEHTPILDGTKRGALIGGYAYAILPGHLLKVFHVTIGEVDQVRAISKGYKHLKETPPWYVIKTAIHRVVKTLPTNPKLMKVIAIMEREEAEDTDAELTPIGGGEADLGGAQPYQLSAAVPREKPKHLMPGAPPGAPYELDASGGPQISDVPAETPPARTDGQRAAAEEAAKGADPYEPTMPFKQGAAAKDSPISKASDKDLADAIRFASDLPKYSAFVTAAEDELERRRMADDDESEGNS